VQVPTLTLDDVECLGELALSGAVRAVRGVLPAALAARKAGRTLVVPRANAEEAARNRNPAKSLSPTMACCSSMSFQSLIARYWRC
jgi:predicted ATPase with chaperone activity